MAKYFFQIMNKNILKGATHVLFFYIKTIDTVRRHFFTSKKAVSEFHDTSLKTKGVPEKILLQLKRAYILSQKN